MTDKKLSRRQFLTYSLIGVGSISLVGAGVWHYSNDYQIVISILKRRLARLKIDNDIFLEFAKEYVKLKQKHKKQLKTLSSISAVYQVVTPYDLLHMGHPLRRLEDNVVSVFLLSTDFFDHQGNIDRQIQYLGFYDPYKIPCRKLF